MDKQTKIERVREALEGSDGSLPTNELIPLALDPERVLPDTDAQENYLKDFLMVEDREETVVTMPREPHNGSIRRTQTGRDETGADEGVMNLVIDSVGEETGVPIFG